VPLRCLIVDDSDHFKEAARLLLEADGLAVVGTASGSAEALRRLEESRPDVVLVDIDLGVESGFDLARLVVRVTDPPHVILISAYEESDFSEMIAASPAAAFLPKPALSGRAIAEIVAAGPR
jgi:CheY-like chemotaxis protein